MREPAFEREIFPETVLEILNFDLPLVSVMAARCP